MNIVIIGAGIVGLATALQILKRNPGLKITILEKESEPAMHQTGNNSGVIHAGVYYKPGSLKAINCRNGYQKLIDFCEKESIRYELCGKLIVASSDTETERLTGLFKRAKANGLDKVTLIPGQQIPEFEPHATGDAALHVPYTGIVNYKEVAGKYAEIISSRHGANIVYNSKVNQVVIKNSDVEVIAQDKPYKAAFLINTAGLYSDKIARLTDKNVNVRIIPFRGEYVQLIKEKEHLVKNLIYPVPDPNFPFLGVHFTRMIKGGVEAGPNAVWAFSREGYQFNRVDLMNVLGDLGWKGFRKVIRKYGRTGLGEYYRSFNKNELAKAMQKLIPEITKDDFQAGGAGVRAQACTQNGGLVDDFLIHENKWAINVLNAPSPAATASLAIGETIANLALSRKRI